MLIFLNKKGTTKLKSVLARTKQDISSVNCPCKDMSNKKVRPTPLFIPSCWMRARMTCCESRQGGVKICDGFAISHVLTTRGRLLAFSAVWNAASKSPRDRCDRTERWLSSKVFLAALAAAPPGDPSTCGVAARLLGGNSISKYHY